MVAAGRDDLCYWARQAKSSTAEVDYLAVTDAHVHPVEVKSGAAGRLQSMHMFLEAHPDCPSGYVFLCAPHSEMPQQQSTFLPLYHAFAAAKPGLPGAVLLEPNPSGLHENANPVDGG